jgi:hypothetical protein
MLYAVQEMSPTAIFSINITAEGFNIVSAEAKHVSADLSAQGLLSAGRAFNASSTKSPN